MVKGKFTVKKEGALFTLAFYAYHTTYLYIKHEKAPDFADYL